MHTRTEEEAMQHLAAISAKMRAEGKLVPPQSRLAAEEEPLAAALDRLRSTYEARSSAFMAHLATLPASRECRAHPGNEAMLNEEASLQAERPVYRCIQCVQVKTANQRERRIIAAGIPADVWHASFENFALDRPNVVTGKGFSAPADFFRHAKAFHARELRNLLLCGDVGIGKGHLAAAIAISWLDAGYPVVWAECQALFRQIHTAYATSANEAVTDRHAGASLLVLDEICLRDLPADGEEILFTILDRRHKAGLPTILLGNANAEAVKLWLGRRISDRLRSGKLAFCFGQWDSMRGTGGDGAQDTF